MTEIGLIQESQLNIFSLSSWLNRAFYVFMLLFWGKNITNIACDDGELQLTSAAYNKQSGRFPAAPQTAQLQRWGAPSAEQHFPCHWFEQRWTTPGRTRVETPARRTRWKKNNKNILLEKEKKKNHQTNRFLTQCIIYIQDMTISVG